MNTLKAYHKFSNLQSHYTWQHGKSTISKAFATLADHLQRILLATDHRRNIKYNIFTSSIRAVTIVSYLVYGIKLFLSFFLLDFT